MPNPVSAGSEFGERKRAEPRQVQSWEKGTGQHWFGRFGVKRKTGSFLRTPKKRKKNEKNEKRKKRKKILKKIIIKGEKKEEKKKKKRKKKKKKEKNEERKI